MHRSRENPSNYRLEVTNIDERYTGIPKVYRILPPIYCCIFEEDSIFNRNDKKTHITTKSGKNKVKYNTFEWTKDYKKAFQALKQVFITAPVLAHFDF